MKRPLSWRLLDYYLHWLLAPPVDYYCYAFENFTKRLDLWFFEHLVSLLWSRIAYFCENCLTLRRHEILNRNAWTILKSWLIGWSRRASDSQLCPSLKLDCTIVQARKQEEGEKVTAIRDVFGCRIELWKWPFQFRRENWRLSPPEKFSP